VSECVIWEEEWRTGAIGEGEGRLLSGVGREALRL